MKFTKTFKKLYKAYKSRARYIDSGGGTRSGKTFSALQLLILKAMGDKKPTITSVVSETMPHLKRGAIRDFRKIMEDEGLWDENNWGAVNCIYTFPNGSIIEFFSADQPGKVQGPARDRLFINEAVNVNYEAARQLFVRTRGFIIIDYNPTHQFWVHTHIQPRENCYTIISTYLDNDYLTPEQIEEIESNKNDAAWWRVYGEGKVGQLEGSIYDFDTIDEMPEDLPECYGLDFGFTNDPTAIVRILADTGKKILYLDEVCYKTRMTNPEIAKLLIDRGVKRTTEIFADCAEPKSIAEITKSGLLVKACNKGAPTNNDRLLFQIQWLKGWKLLVTKRSLNLINELRNYVWMKDNEGNTLNKPIDKYNHLMDAMRYGAWTKFGKGANSGQYTIGYR